MYIHNYIQICTRCVTISPKPKRFCLLFGPVSNSIQKLQAERAGVPDGIAVTVRAAVR